MSDDHRKKPALNPAHVPQYHPAAAVKARGDDWTYGREVWNTSAAQNCAVRDTVTQDYREWVSMRCMERGEMGRV